MNNNIDSIPITAKVRNKPANDAISIAVGVLSTSGQI
jgi:hypothetical protein